VFLEATEEVVPRVGVLELDGGRVLQPHAVVVTGSGRLLQEQCWYFGTTRPREHPIFLHPFPPAPAEVPGRLGVLATRGDSNYYHFLHDALPRTAVLEQAPEAGPVDRWYVPRAARFQRELLDLWGIPEDRVVDASTVPHVRAEHLVVPGVPSLTERNPPWVAQLLRQRLCPPELARVPGRHLYLTRGTARNNRVVENEAEVLALLAPLGFTSVDPGELSVAEQVRTFAEADVIVAPHGAALANLVFCSPGSAVVELFPAQSFVADYWKMASGVTGLEYRYLSGAGAPVGTTRAEFVVADITVDLPRLEAVVTELLAAR
jgi:capsular polysaccharide biosynthesis protein